MVRLEWNALRVGDQVFVHDPSDADLRLVPGVVAMVETVKGSNDIGIRVGSDGDSPRVVRPTRLSVHADPVDPSESCWRCDAIAAGTDRPSRRPTGAAVQ